MRSMTGFAALERSDAQALRSWEIRAVNGRGLDIRLRLPEGYAALEKELRARIGAAIGRGNVSLSLKIAPSATATAFSVDPAALEAALQAIEAVEAAAKARGQALAPVSAAGVLGLRGVVDAGPATPVPVPMDVLMEDFEALLSAFNGMRAEEGTALQGILFGQVDEIARLTQAATDLAEARAAHMASVFSRAVERVLKTEADPEKIAHDVAALAVKADVTEELDRLRAHVEAARSLLNVDGPVGRKLDFLTQEFNREANTLCSKAQFSALTEIGLGLKTVVDQMREQVQNVE